MTDYDFIFLEKQIEGQGVPHWFEVSVEVNSGVVVKKEGKSPYSGHEETRVVAKYKVKDPKKVIRKLIKEGYDVMGDVPKGYEEFYESPFKEGVKEK